MAEIPKTTHTGELKFGDMVIPCAVLEDNQHIITQQGVLEALGASIDEVIGALPTRSLKGLARRVSLRPICFRNPEGVEVQGYLAESLFEICQLYQDAMDTNIPTQEQQEIAARCATLLRGLAVVGITAFIDEATGYQRDKDKQALHRILDDYFPKELASLAKRLPEEFYEHLFRLRRWQYHPLSLNHPKYLGKSVEELIFKQLPAEVLEELKRTSSEEAETETNAQLDRQILRVITLMKVSSNWRGFESLFARAHPQKPVVSFDH